MRVLVTGSADGLGRTAAEQLAAGGHDVVLQARSPQRAEEARAAVPAATHAVAGDLARLADVRAVAETVNASGRLDAVIHNAGVGYGEPLRRTDEGLPHVFAINVLAPYVLTCLMLRPPRLVFLSSGMHRGGDPALSDLTWERRRWNPSRAYSDSKLFDTVLAFALARRWPEVCSNAVDPGWVPTRMGGPAAPDDPAEGAATQVWLATAEDPETRTSGALWHHRRRREAHPAASDPAVQDGLIEACAELSGIPLPG